MLKQPICSTLRVLAGAFLLSAAPFALAGGHPDVNWSINIGSGYSAPRIYTPAPAVVYVQPQPVYVQPATVVSYGYPYYGDGHRHKHKHKHKHHWKHHHED
ncbi:hypothetical protein D3871_12090 [Noviherbaspirillum saxi]|uniref:PXPV repeat-containing protein n=2 Tax=Noviherbaspirillum saxi TaxID=2320863 RepID=A0A3A3FSM9_9BURK|nr:hypothetical protein D3871_12090 [Noviherbaspirillum saxi]